jgi:uncharacterized protein
MNLIDDLLLSLPDGQIRGVRVGAFWTAVEAETRGEVHCGLASTLWDEEHHYSNEPAVRDAGMLAQKSARELAALAQSASSMEATLGIATINALLQHPTESQMNLNAEDIIAQYGADKCVVLVGHFPFVPRLRERLGRLLVLEQQPRDGDLPANRASEVIPQADVLAITATTIINRTFDALMALRHPDALVLVLGPSTPLSPILFDYRVHILSGAVVEDVQAVMCGVSQGANFRQLHRLGIRLVTMQKMASV